jgi:membrane protein
MLVKGYRLKPLLAKTGQEILSDDVLGMAAQTAYYFFFSLFPIFLFVAPLLSLVGDKRETFEYLLERMHGTVPDEAFALLKSVIEQVVFTDNAPGLISIGALLALWSGSNVFNALGGVLNRAYDVEEGRPWWKQRLISIACLLGVGGMFVLATVVMLAGGNIVDALADRLGIGAVGRMAWAAAQYVIAFGLLVLTAAAIFYYLPNVRQHKHHALVAALVTTTLWVGVTLGFRAYVQNFGNYNATYGAIGAVIVLLTWMYLSMVVLLAGGELASELHKGTGAVRTRAGLLIDGRISNGGPTDVPSVEHVERVVPRAVDQRVGPTDAPPRPTSRREPPRVGGGSGAALPPRAD